MSSRANDPASRWITCEKCNHRGYFSRSDARAVKKTRHAGDKGMYVFECPHTEGMFHVGHRSPALTSGQINRDVLRNQAIRAVAMAGGHRR